MEEYTDGTRVVLDFTEDRLLNNEAIAKIIQDIKQNCGEDVPLSTHLIETESESWASVAEYDPFLKELCAASLCRSFPRRSKPCAS